MPAEHTVTFGRSPDPRLVAAIVDRVTSDAHIPETGTGRYPLCSTRSRTRRKNA